MKVKANKRLMIARAEHGYTIKELSRVSGVPTATISRAENGQPLSVKSAGKLCRALDEVFTDLFEVETNNIIEEEKHEQGIKEPRA